MDARNPYPCRPSVGRAADQGAHRRKIAIGEHVREVQTIFRPIFGAEDVKADGGDFDRLAQGRRAARRRRPEIEVMFTPGHTPAASATGSAMRCSSAIRCSCPTMAPRGPIFRAAMRAAAVSVDPQAPVAAAGNPAVHVPRLQGARPRPICLGNDGRRAAPGQQAYPRWSWRGGVRRHAAGARQMPVDAPPADPLDPGQYAGRAVPAGRGQRRPLSCGFR